MKDILHCDLNCFFASVEMLKNSSLKNVPMAVCGDPKLRHGIILAKNDLAKKYGIVTAETIYSAQKKCRNLVLVKSNHEEYEKYSKLVNQIYLKYTDKVEPFGIDESFLDVTESKSLFGNAITIANLIKEDVKNTLGLTISIGVSFNKALAKLGSDLKKPDAITVLNVNNFKKIIYPLPVNMLIYVGKSTLNILNKIGIKTIGDLANYDKVKLIKFLGKSGSMLYNFANGLDSDIVCKYDDIKVPKSISQGTTFKEDVQDIKFLENYIKEVSDDISSKLRKYNLKCTVVSITIKDSLFVSITRQKCIGSTDIFQEISAAAIFLLKENYIDQKPVRALTVSIGNFVDPKEDTQICMFNPCVTERNKIAELTKVVDIVRCKYGNDKVGFGVLGNKDC